MVQNTLIISKTIQKELIFNYCKRIFQLLSWMIIVNSTRVYWAKTCLRLWERCFRSCVVCCVTGSSSGHVTFYRNIFLVPTVTFISLILSISPLHRLSFTFYHWLKILLGANVHRFHKVKYKSKGLDLFDESEITDMSETILIHLRDK